MFDLGPGIAVSRALNYALMVHFLGALTICLLPTSEL
jgi:hypothetical protein